MELILFQFMSFALKLDFSPPPTLVRILEQSVKIRDFYNSSHFPRKQKRFRNKNVKAKKNSVSVFFSRRCTRYIRERVEHSQCLNRKVTVGLEGPRRRRRAREREREIRAKMKLNKLASIFAIYFTFFLLNSIDAR